MSVSSRLRRPSLLAAFAVLLIGMLVSACSSSTEDAAPSSAANSGYPLTVQTTRGGEVTIPAKPVRIVALANAGLENLLALGEKPIAAVSKNAAQLPYLAQYANDPMIDPTLSDPNGLGVKVEAIAAKRPDLIIAPAWDTFVKIKDQLDRIAPTVLFDSLGTDPDWRKGFLQVGQALNKRDEAQRLLDKTEASYRALATKHAGLAEKTYSFGWYRNNGISLGPGGAVLRLTGMKPAADQSAVEDGDQRREYAAENLMQVEGQIVVLMPRPASERAALEASPLWPQLSPRVVLISETQGEAINNGGYLAKSWLPESLDADLGRIVAG